MRNAGGYDVGYDQCSRTTHFVTVPGRLDIMRVSDAMVPTEYDKSKQHTFSMPSSHHLATLSLKRADVGSVGCYEVG